MLLGFLALSVAHAQSFEIGAVDEGATVSLLDEAASCVVDLSSTAVDLDEVWLQTPEVDTTFGEISQAALDVAGDLDDRAVLSLGDRDQLYLALMGDQSTPTGPGRVCRALMEYRCFTIARIRFCSFVEVGTTCCDDGTRSCGDYILYPGED